MVLNKDAHGCPYLILAPMEGVGDRSFRKSMAAIGGFDEAVTDFIRVPSNAHVKSLARNYLADETSPIPLAAQLMGSDLDLMAAMAQEIEKKGAPRIDLNCGCPSKTKKHLSGLNCWIMGRRLRKKLKMTLYFSP